ncbi:MAG: XcyI family restriction endonuclease [Gammaproteobacteria bacterium]
MPISIPVPQLQIDFAFALEQIRGLYLQQALSEAVGKLDIKRIDAELAQFVPSVSLTELATRGLRGELMFAVPRLLSSSPRLLGYYRLLLGFSQKAFYTAQFGLARFKSMEEKGVLTAGQAKRLDELCSALVGSAAALLDGVGVDRITRELLEDLAILTVGSLLRGRHNVKLGLAGIVRVFDAISSIVAHTAVTTEPICIELRNAAGGRVLIEFSSDPDIIIREEMAPDAYRNIIAIEVKGGMDFSNIHNRIGEAEKSHQKARAAGFHECWTVVNVDRIDLSMARRESPSTNRFYRLSQIDGKSGDEYVDFRNRVISLTGISSP